MSFLSFRQARRKAKKIVSVRAQRPPTPPSPDRDSCVFPSVVEIGDPSRVSAEAFYSPATLHVDITSGPLFPSDPFPGSDHPSTNAGQSQDQASHTGLGGASSKLLHDGAGSEQQRDGSLAGSTVGENVTGTPRSRRTLKATPTPIRIPIPHMSKVQIQRSASISAVPDPPFAKPGDSPVLDDSASVVSGITLPLIANVWTIQADQPRDHRQSRCITRTDSATLPHGEQGFMKLSARTYTGLSDEDGEFLVPPVPPLPTAISESTASLHISDQGNGDIAFDDDKAQLNAASSSSDQTWQNTTVSFSASRPQGISSMPELSICTPSHPGTPDLIKDSATSAGGRSSDMQLQTFRTPDSAPSAWSGPMPSSLSGREITIVLNFLSASPSNRELASEKTESSSQPSQAGASTSNPNLNERISSGAPPSPQRRSDVSLAARRAPRSRSGSRPSLASVNTLLLHPATLLPIGERRRLSSHNRSESVGSTQAASPGDTDTLSCLPSALGTSLIQHISQLPSFPESAVHPSASMSPSVSSSLGSPSPPPSPDLLDNIVLADGRDLRAPNHDMISAEQRSPDELLTGSSVGEQRSYRASLASLPGSGSKQTFPETPNVFTPMFSPTIDSSRVIAFQNANSLAMRYPSVTRSLRVRGSRQSQKFFVGRSASTKVSMEIKARMKSSRSRVKRMSVHNLAANGTSGQLSSRLPETSDVSATTKSDEVQLNNVVFIRPRPMASDDSPKPADSRISASARCKHPQSQMMKICVPPTPLTLPPSPPSPREHPGESVSDPTSPSLRSLPPPPPPPKLRRPPPPFSQSPAGPPLPPKNGSPHVLATRPPSAPPPPFDGPSTDNSPTSIPLPYRSPTPSPQALPPVASPDHLRASPPALPAYNSTLPPNGYSPDRPPRPLGPRALYRNASDIGKPDGLSSSSSTESVSRRTLMGSRNWMSTGSSTSFSSSPGPRFQTSPADFKVHTLEAARWSFSSEELQGIVSEAIKQSGGVSFIRLLSQQAAFVEIPGELERLTALQNELKVQYRLQVRKRDALLKSIYAYSETPEFKSFAVRSKMQELNETMETLDKVAEELYHARDQAAQLSRMLAVHSGSALAMALRKLHSSFAKRTVEVQEMRDYVTALEAERDEAWTQAQQVARDLDSLNDTLQSQDSSPAATRSASCRSSRVMASRKSSIRLSKAGLRLSRGQRASMASQIGSARLSYASSAGTQPASPGPIPPVPRIPDRLSSLNCLTTSGLSSRGSARTSDLSFSSEAHALARAQAELYGYLGIDDPELRPSPLRRSSIAASPSVLSHTTRDDVSRRRSDSAADRWTTRGGGPLDRFQAYMENKPGALLATFNILDS